MTFTNRPALLVAVPAVLALVPALLAAPAYAEPPPNDDIAGAVAITRDSTTTFDTTEATADILIRCVGDKSVWFRFTAERTGRVALTTAGSSFDTRLAVFTGRRNDPQRVDCDNNSGPGDSSSENFRTQEGKRYWIAVSSADSGAGGPGVLRWGNTASPFDVTVEGATSGGTSGKLFVFGTLSCEEPAEAWLYASVSQRVGDDKIARGTGRKGRIQCDGESEDWRVPIDSDTGWAFQPGPLSLRLTTGVWNGLAFAEETSRTNVTAVDDPDARSAH